MIRRGLNYSDDWDISISEVDGSVERREHSRAQMARQIHEIPEGDVYDLSPGVGLHLVLYLGLLPNAAMSCFRWISDPTKCHTYITFPISSS